MPDTPADKKQALSKDAGRKTTAEPTVTAVADGPSNGQSTVSPWTKGALPQAAITPPEKTAGSQPNNQVGSKSTGQNTDKAPKSIQTSNVQNRAPKSKSKSKASTSSRGSNKSLKTATQSSTPKASADSKKKSSISAPPASLGPVSLPEAADAHNQHTAAIDKSSVPAFSWSIPKASLGSSTSSGPNAPSCYNAFPASMGNSAKAASTVPPAADKDKKDGKKDGNKDGNKDDKKDGKYHNSK